MSRYHVSFRLLALLMFAPILLGHGARAEESTSPRVVDLKAPDGTSLKGTYFSAGKPGPGVLLLHQCNRQRKVWDDLAARLAAAGFHVMTVDLRGTNFHPRNCTWSSATNFPPTLKRPTNTSSPNPA